MKNIENDNIKILSQFVTMSIINTNLDCVIWAIT